MGRPTVARDRYAKALAIAPGEPTVLNNLALSYLLAGEMQEAERILREASQSPKATSRIRQNLALVVGLQGRYDEAEQIARAELDERQAEANIAYLRAMMSQADTMKKKKKSAA
jgi:Flp pilus assembly protein TadD